MLGGLHGPLFFFAREGPRMAARLICSTPEPTSVLGLEEHAGAVKT